MADQDEHETTSIDGDDESQPEEDAPQETIQLAETSVSDEQNAGGSSTGTISIDHEWIQQLEGERSDSTRTLESFSSRNQQLLEPEWQSYLQEHSPLFTHRKYEIYPPFASGGMGTIFWAYDTSLLRPVAFKVLSLEAPNDMILERFMREASITAQLSHPNIVPIYEVGRLASGEIYYTMELVKGDSLKTILDSIKFYRENQKQVVSEKSLEQFQKGKKYHEKYTRFRLLQIFQDVCQTIHFAHRRGVLHRDLKPANLMIGEDGQVKVLDWGVAAIREEIDFKAEASEGDDHQNLHQLGNKNNQRLTKHGDFLGTPSFLSPEQARGDLERIGPHSDVFSLGCILYNILTFRPWLKNPSQQTDVQETRKAIANTEPFPPRTIDRSIPPELESITLNCLEKNPEDRYASADDLNNDLQAFFENRTVSAHTGGILNKTRKMIQRNKNVAILTASFFLLFVSGIWWFFTQPGTITVNVQPESAQTANIVLEGNESSHPIKPGKTHEIPAGQYTLRISHQDFKNEQKKVEINHFSNHQRTFQLTPSTGALYVRTKVRRTAISSDFSESTVDHSVRPHVTITPISSDGSVTGDPLIRGRTAKSTLNIKNWSRSKPEQGLFQLPAGSRYRIMVHATGFLKETRTISVSSGEKRTITIPLIGDKGHLSLSGNGMHALAYRQEDEPSSGTTQSLSPLLSSVSLPCSQFHPSSPCQPPISVPFNEDQRLATGSYHVVARKPGYFSQARTASVRFNQRTSVSFSFAPLNIQQKKTLSGTPVGYLAEDLSGDGKMDFVFLTARGTLKYLKNGTTTWSRSFSPFPTSIQSVPFLVRDFNQDGQPDLGFRTPKKYVVISLDTGKTIWTHSFDRKLSPNTISLQGTLSKTKSQARFLLPTTNRRFEVLNPVTGKHLNTIDLSTWRIASRVISNDVPENDPQIYFLGHHPQQQKVALLSGTLSRTNMLNRSVHTSFLNASSNNGPADQSRTSSPPGNLWKIRASDSPSSRILCAFKNHVMMVDPTQKSENWIQTVDVSREQSLSPDALHVFPRKDRMFIHYRSGKILPLTRKGSFDPPFYSPVFLTNTQSQESKPEASQRTIRHLFPVQNGWLTLSSQEDIPYHILDFRGKSRHREIGLLPTKKTRQNKSTKQKLQKPETLLFARKREKTIRLGVLIHNQLLIYRFSPQNSDDPFSVQTSVHHKSESNPPVWTVPQFLSSNRILVGDRQLQLDFEEDHISLTSPSSNANQPSDLLPGRTLIRHQFSPTRNNYGLLQDTNGRIHLHRNGEIISQIGASVNVSSSRQELHDQNGDGIPEVFLVGDGGTLYQFDGETGEKLQEKVLFDTSQSFVDLRFHTIRKDQASPSRALAVLTSDHLLSIDPDNFRIRWKHDRPSGIRMGGQMETGDGDQDQSDELYIQTTNGLSVIDGRSGKRIRTLPEFVSVTGVPTLVNVPEENLSPPSSQTKNGSGTQSENTESILLVSDELKGQITAIHPKTFETLWTSSSVLAPSVQNPLTRQQFISRPVFTSRIDDQTFVGIIGTKTDRIHLLHPVTGEEVMSFSIPSPENQSSSSSSVDLRNAFASARSTSSRTSQIILQNNGRSQIAIQLRKKRIVSKTSNQKSSSPNETITHTNSSNDQNGTPFHRAVWRTHYYLQDLEKQVSFLNLQQLYNQTEGVLKTTQLFPDYFTSSIQSQKGETFTRDTSDSASPQPDQIHKDSSEQSLTPLLQKLDDLSPGYKFLYGHLLRIRLKYLLYNADDPSSQTDSPQPKQSSPPPKKQNDTQKTASIVRQNTSDSPVTLFKEALSSAPRNVSLLQLWLRYRWKRQLHTSDTHESPFLPDRSITQKWQQKQSFQSPYHQWFLDVLRTYYQFETGRLSRAKTHYKKQFQSDMPLNRTGTPFLSLPLLSPITNSRTSLETMFYFFRRRNVIDENTRQKHIFTPARKQCNQSTSDEAWICLFLADADPRFISYPLSLQKKLHNILFSLPAKNKSRKDLRLLITKQILRLQRHSKDPNSQFLQSFYNNYQTLFLKTQTRKELESLLKKHPDSFRKKVLRNKTK